MAVKGSVPIRFERVFPHGAYMNSKVTAYVTEGFSGLGGITRLIQAREIVDPVGVRADARARLVVRDEPGLGGRLVPDPKPHESLRKGWVCHVHITPCGGYSDGFD